MLLGLVVTFRRLDPTTIGEYRPCAGGWHESEFHACEQGLKYIPQQPVNTYSNLAYAAAGAITIFHLGTAQALVFCLLMSFLCVGSSLYHATSTRWAGKLDVAGIYGVFTCLGLLGILRFTEIAGWLQATMAFGSAILAGWLLRFKYNGNMQVKIAIMLSVIYLFAFLGAGLSGQWNPSGWFLVGSLLCFGLAFLIWNLDKARKFPLPRWGHGFWHILTAASSTLVFYAIAILD